MEKETLCFVICIRVLSIFFNFIVNIFSGQISLGSNFPYARVEAEFLHSKKRYEKCRCRTKMEYSVSKVKLENERRNKFSSLCKITTVRPTVNGTL